MIARAPIRALPRLSALRGWLALLRWTLVLPSMLLPSIAASPGCGAASQEAPPRAPRAAGAGQTGDTALPSSGDTAASGDTAETGDTAASGDTALPSTDRDPLPFTPAPMSHGRTDVTVALSASGGEDQARQMLPALLIAIRDADERGLDSLFADEVGSTDPQRQRPARRGRSRAMIVQSILLHARRAILPVDAQVTDLVDLEALTVTRAAGFWQGGALPDDVRPTDLVLEITLLEPGRRPLRTVLGWNTRAAMVVRPGSDPRIVAL